MILTAHRSAAGYAVENSEAAIDIAVGISDRLGVDLHALASGEIVTMHDRDVRRTTTGRGLLRTMQLDEFRRLNLVGPDGEAMDEKPKLLQEFVEYVNWRKPILVETKYFRDRNAAAGMIRAIKNCVPEEAMEAGQFQAMTFYHGELLALQEAFPCLQTGVLYWRHLRKNPNTIRGIQKATMINFASQFIREDDVARMQGMGKEVNAYVVNDDNDARRIAAMGVDGLITDYPDKFPYLQADPRDFAQVA